MIKEDCPFCGSDDLTLSVTGAYDHGYSVYCINCMCEGPFIVGLDEVAKTAAIDAWNKRVVQ